MIRDVNVILKPFEDMAKRDKERYDKDMEEYKNKSK